MKVVAYFRCSPDCFHAEQELAVQKYSVAAWIEREGATLIATFTEEERGLKSRKEFGRARKAASAAGAVLLVATTKAIGASGRFTPHSSTNPRIVCLQDLQEAEREALSRSRLLVLYQRRTANPDEFEQIQASLIRREIEHLINPHIHTVLAELVEEEPVGRSGERPAFRQALALCLEKRARLVIGTTDAIAGGEPFLPPISEVPFEVAYRAQDEWPDFMPASATMAEMPIAIHFGTHCVRNRVPVYLVNRTGSMLNEVTVTRSGWTLGYGDLTQMNASITEVSVIPNDLAGLVGSYELAFMSDFTISFRVTAKDEKDRTWTGSVTIDKGEPPRLPLCLWDWRLADADAG